MNGLKRHSGVLPWVVLLLVWLGAAEAQSPRNAAGTLADRTRFATPWHIIESGAEGPTVMIVGGMHGNEPAGAAAAERVLHWPIARGRLIVLPRANARGLDLQTRYLPGEPPEHRDLNRNFPTSPEDAPRGELASALWLFVREHRPDWFIDLHEAWGVHKITRGTARQSVGNAIIADPSNETRRMARHMLMAVNLHLADPDETFLLIGPPILSGMTRAAHDQLNARAMTLETTTTNQPLEQRVNQHLRMVERLLTELNMLSPPDERTAE